MTAIADAGSPEVSALAINVVIPPELRWTDVRRGEEFELQTLTVRLLHDGSLAVKAYGRPTGGGRGAYVSFAMPDRPELTALVDAAAGRAAELWAANTGLGEHPAEDDRPRGDGIRRRSRG
jgi:hypothetical protein